MTHKTAFNKTRSIKLKGNENGRPCLSAGRCDAGLIWQNTSLPTQQKTCSFPVGTWVPRNARLNETLAVLRVLGGKEFWGRICLKGKWRPVIRAFYPREGELLYLDCESLVSINCSKTKALQFPHYPKLVAIV